MKLILHVHIHCNLQSTGANIKHVETRQPTPDTNNGFGFYIECQPLAEMEDIVKKLETSSCTDVKANSVTMDSGK